MFLPTRLSRVVCATLLTGSLLLPAANLARGGRLEIYAAVPGALPEAFRASLGAPLGALSPNRPLHLAIGIVSRDPRGLNRAVSAIYDRRSPLYHHYLTPATYNARFGPDPAYVASLSTWLRGQGVRVSPWHGGHLLDINGDVGTIAAALHIRLFRYHLPPAIAAQASECGLARGVLRQSPAPCEGYAADRLPSLPASLAGGILGISGLDNVVRAIPQAHLSAPSRAHTQHSAGFGPSGGMDPAQVLSAYDFTPIHAAGFHGEKLSVDLVELAPYDRSDINAYNANYNVNPTITDTAIDGGAANQAPSLEPTLDIEELSTAAPAAAIHVYSAPNDTTTGALHAYSAVAQAHDAAVVGIGWAVCEPFARTLYGYVEIAHATLRQMAAEGMTVVAPTDDSGAYSCGAVPVPTMQGLLAVSLPASDPYVTAVGGTVMTLSPTNTIASETAWRCKNGPGGCGNARGPEGFGSGGGLSQIFGPNDGFGTDLSWQTGPGVRNNYSNGYRQVPDVSISGTYTDGNDHAYSFYYQGKWQNGGGTSAAAPMWMALLVLADQYLLSRGQQVLGWANPQLYQIAAGNQPYPPYHDITDGDNLYYPATPGWDYATGWGSPDAWNVVRDIGNVAAPPLPTLPPTHPPAAVTATPTITPSATATIAPSATATVTTTATRTRTATATATHPRPTPSPTATPTARPCPAAGLGNGGFEAGSLLCWRASGQGTRVVRTAHHTGHAAFALGNAAAPAHPQQAGTLSQHFTLPAADRRPVLHLSYWLTHTVAACGKGATCQRAVPQAPQVRVLDARNRVLAKAALTPHRERSWSGLALPFAATPGGYTLQITLPAQPARVGMLVYVDDVRVD